MLLHKYVCVCAHKKQSKRAMSTLRADTVVSVKECVFLPWVNTVKQTHFLPPLHVNHTHTQNLAWIRNWKAGVKGERLWEHRGPIEWTCLRPDKLTSNINNHIYISEGQYPREESTIHTAAARWASNNTTQVETTSWAETFIMNLRPAALGR